MIRTQRSPSPMSRRLRGMLPAIVLIALAPLAIGCGAADRNSRAEASDVAALPVEIREALARAAGMYPQPLDGANWLSHSVTSGTEHPIYQVRGVNRRGLRIEAEVTSAGRVIEVEERGIPLEEVPTPVVGLMKTRIPSANPDRIEAIYQAGQPQPVTYGFEGIGLQGKQVEVYISADGKTFLN